MLQALHQPKSSLHKKVPSISSGLAEPTKILTKRGTTNARVYRESLQANPTCVQSLSEYNLAIERHLISVLGEATVIPSPQKSAAVLFKARSTCLGLHAHALSYCLTLFGTTNLKLLPPGL